MAGEDTCHGAKYNDKIYTEKDFGNVFFENFKIENLKSKLKAK